MRSLCSATTLAALLAAATLSLVSRTADAQSATPERTARAGLYLSRLQGYGFAGTLLSAHGDAVTLTSGYGSADRERGIPFGPRTLFDIGSLTKQFTAAAILRLAADGRLTVHDSVGRFLRDVPPAKRGITLHHLLTHTSGLPMGLGGDYRRVSRDTLVARALAVGLASAPGARHAYSNVGYSLLAAVVEIASGLPYETFLQTRLFRPAGLRETGYTFAPSVRSRFAVGYVDGARWGIGIDSTAATRGEFWNLLGNGGLQSSVEDLHRWARALRAGRVLPPGAVAELMRPHVLAIREYREPGAPLYYGYGWYVWERRGKTVVFHDGSNGIFYASLRLYPDDDRMLAYGSNVSTFASVTPIPAIDRILLGEAVELPPRVRPVALTADRWAGRYTDAAGRNALHVRLDGPSLRIVGEGEAAFTFVHSGSWTVSPVLDALSARTERFAELSRTGRYDSLAAFIRPPTTLDLIRRVEAAFWRTRDSALGAYVNTRVLGTRPARARASPFPATTYVATTFSRGTAYREFVWDSTRTLTDYGPITAPPSARFFAASPECVVAFDAAAARSARICFTSPRGVAMAVVRPAEGARRLRLAP